MTSRNLNRTWRDVVFKQYEADHAADVPFPVRYLIHADPWNKDIFIEAPAKIDPAVYRQAVLKWVIAKRLEDDPAYEDDLIKVRARVSWINKSEAEKAATPPCPRGDGPAEGKVTPQDGTERQEAGDASNDG
ncbi:hypothetical protein QBC47DRAFT_389974 [Echria macrotheca]|uniref:Uncharacterized protein n=1 Tax=Echria macrotheca TaxID=438768 RepID=A0AAJ0B622_9PEZI|nr:hypothetical protein QBC47DRAFT_389974 [Echria macrotheca]